MAFSAMYIIFRLRTKAVPYQVQSTVILDYNGSTV